MERVVTCCILVKRGQALNDSSKVLVVVSLPVQLALAVWLTFGRYARYPQLIVKTLVYDGDNGQTSCSYIVLYCY